MRKIPTKNYIILLVVTCITVLLTFYINAWAKAYKEEKISISPLSGMIEEVGVSELKQALSETNEVLVYVGNSDSKKIYDSEENILNYIRKHNLADRVIYVNIKEHLKNNEYLDILKSTFEEARDEIKNAPMLIYVKNGKAIEVRKSSGGIIKTKDFSVLVKAYDLD